MKQKHFWVNVGELLFGKFEFTSFMGKIIIVVGRCIPEFNVPNDKSSAFARHSCFSFEKIKFLLGWFG